MQELILYTNDAPELDPARFAGWQLIARAKQKCDATLERNALELQGVMFGWEQAGQKDLEDKLAAYRKAWNELAQERKKFTAILDIVKDSAMKTEKLYAPQAYQPYIYAEARELQLRQEAAKEAAQAQAKANEVAQFNAHVMNQYASVAMEYKARLERIAQQVYEDCLYAKTPEDQTANAKDIALKVMADEKPQAYRVFQRTLLTQAEAVELGGRIVPPDFSAIQSKAAEFLEDRFVMYAHDLANAEAAIVASRTELQAQQVTEQQQVEQTAAVNQLTQSASVFVAAGPTVKEKTTMVIEGDSEKWVLTIIAAFMANFQLCFKKIKNKDYSKITVAQMAAALDAAEVTVQGVQYNTVQK
jgi:hypothetical protein